MSADDFRRDLLDARLLVASGVEGIYHRSFAFEEIARAVGTYASAAGSEVEQVQLLAAPLQARTNLERTGYATSFPNLLGIVASFSGTEADVPAYLEAVEAGGEWLDHMAPTDVALCSAACHSIYPLLSHTTVPNGGLHFEVQAWCFRHEPSPDPARMQSFRMHEFVFVGSPDGAVAHRDRWLTRGQQLLANLGLHVESEVANDPFFGRSGRLLAANQRVKELKFELVCPISSSAPGAIASSNYHEDHFSETFEFRLEDGGPAHTSCVGFGLERTALALFFEHGLDVSRWPAEVRARLGVGAHGTAARVGMIDDSKEQG